MAASKPTSTPLGLFSPFRVLGPGLAIFLSLFVLLLLPPAAVSANPVVVARQNDEQPSPAAGGRSRVSINAGWRFQRWTTSPDGLNYNMLKPYVLPSANPFIVDPSKHHVRPGGGTQQPWTNVTQAQPALDDGAWEAVDVPHDWAIKGPFYEGANPLISTDMGRLPVHGIGWYRRRITVRAEEVTKSTYLEVDGAMAFASVWLNGYLVGGWPYGYASFSIDLTPYVREGENLLAVRLENGISSSRWYPGAGIYRNVWLTRVEPTHVAYLGTFVTAREVSAESATLDASVRVENNNMAAAEGVTELQVVTDVHVADAETGKPVGDRVAQFPSVTVSLAAGSNQTVNSSVAVQNPRLWGPRPQKPNMYVAVTRLLAAGAVVDMFETPFGIQKREYTRDGLRINGQPVYMQGVNQHHDLGALGTAVSGVALARQLEMLQDMGCNAIRTSHNPPAPEMLRLADRMGMLIFDEIFDAWASSKRVDDFAQIFPDWSEADARAFVRRDRNHPSVVIWSYGNEVHEQSQGEAGVAIARRLRDYIRQEDPSRLSTVGMNTAGPDSAFAAVADIVGLNYQGEGRGYDPPGFDRFRSVFPDKMMFTTESSSAISSRGTYIFPVTRNNTSIATTGTGLDAPNRFVSAYDLYSVPWGASPDKCFASQDRYPYVTGEYVWTGWDYIGEPTPFDSAAADSSRSSYFGIIDLAGFPKDRFWLYQSRWNPDVRMAHILPHWTWPERVGEVTPVHVFSSADEAELFVNGASQGRLRRAQFEYRFRWDRIMYEPGEVRVVTYKDGAEWAVDSVRTAGNAAALHGTTYRNRTEISTSRDDLAFFSVGVVDAAGILVPRANDTVTFAIVEGPGEIVATDNGDPRDRTAFPVPTRKAFNGKAMAIVRAKPGAVSRQAIRVSASADGLEAAEVVITVR